MSDSASPNRNGGLNVPVITPRRKSLSEAAEQEIQQRKSYSLQGILHPERKGKLFEHFMVTGLPPRLAISTPSKPSQAPSNSLNLSKGQTSSSNTRSKDHITQYTPEILYSFPPFEQGKKLMVPQFTFPEGLSSRDVRRLATEIEMNQVIFAPLSTVEESDSSFVFLLTGEDALLYGVCVIHEELLRDQLSFANSGESATTEETTDTENSKAIEASTEGYIVAPRCYMFLTRFPFFSTHFQVLYSILALERTSRLFSKMAPGAASTSSEVLALLEQYRSFDVPRGELNLSITLPEEQLNFMCPAGDEDAQLIDFCMVCLIKLVPLDTLLTLLNAILQEFQILIISSQVSVVSALCMGLIPLMRPYVWQGTFIPVLPVSLAECINSPMPYIMGSPRLDAAALEDAEEVLVWDVDKQTLSGVPHDLIPLPYVDSLRQQLGPLHSLLFETVEPARRATFNQPYANSKSETEICHAILLALRQYHKDMHHTILKAMNKIHRFDLTKPRHVTKLLVEIGDDNYTAFLKRFLSTQHWHFFYDNMKIGDDSLFNVHQANDIASSVESSKGHEALSRSLDSSSSMIMGTPNSSGIPNIRSMVDMTELSQASSSSIIAAVSEAFEMSDDDDLVLEDDECL